MFIIDTHGRKTETPAHLKGASLAEKLLSAAATIKRSPLDQTGTIFIYLDRSEEESFMESYKRNLWIKTFEGQQFTPITEDFGGALDSIVSGINKNHTNSWGRFVPCRGAEIQPEPLRAKPIYGWIYIPVPNEVTLSDGDRISITFSK